MSGDTWILSGILVTDTIRLQSIRKQVRWFSMLSYFASFAPNIVSRNFLSLASRLSEIIILHAFLVYRKTGINTIKGSFKAVLCADDVSRYSPDSFESPGKCKNWCVWINQVGNTKLLLSSFPLTKQITSYYSNRDVKLQARVCLSC